MTFAIPKGTDDFTMRPDELTVATPPQLGFIAAIYNSWETKLHAYGPFANAADLESADTLQIERMKAAGIPDGDIPPQLNANDPALIGLNLRSDKAFIEDALAEEEANDIQDKLMANQHFIRRWGEDETKLRRMKEKYPNVPIMTRDEMWKQIRLNNQRLLWQESGGVKGGFLAKLATGIVGATAATIAGPTRDPVSFIQTIAGVGLPISYGANIFTKAATSYGMNFIPQFVNDITGTNENLRMLGYDPTLGETIVNAAISAAIPTGLHMAGEFFRAAGRRAAARRATDTRPMPPPAPTVTAEPSGAIPAEVTPGAYPGEPVPVAGAEAPTARSVPVWRSGAAEIVYNYVNTPAERVRLAKDITTAERQINEYGTTAADILPHTIDDYPDIQTKPYVRGAVHRTQQTTQDYSNRWAQISQGMPAGEAARMYDTVVFDKLDTLTAKLDAEYAKAEHAKTINAEIAAGSTATWDAAIREAMRAVNEAKSARAQQSAARRVVSIVEQKAGGKLDENAAGIAAAKQKLLDHMPLVYRAFKQSNGLWEVSKKMADEINTAIADHLNIPLTGKAKLTEGVTPPRRAKSRLVPGDRPAQINFSNVERPPMGPVEIDPYGQVNIPELARPEAQAGAKPNEPKIAGYERTQKAELKAQDDAIDPMEMVVKRLIAAFEAEDTKEGATVEIAGRQHAVYPGQGLDDVFGTGKKMTVKEVLQELKEDFDVEGAVTTCQTGF